MNKYQLYKRSLMITTVRRDGKVFLEQKFEEPQINGSVVPTERVASHDNRMKPQPRGENGAALAVQLNYFGPKLTPTLRVIKHQRAVKKSFRMLKCL